MTPPLLDGASQELQAFLAESPLNRPHIARFVREFLATIPAQAEVLDAGAGASPYTELFARHRRVSTDWAGSMHAEALEADVVAPIEALPLADARFDAVVCTEVVEHLPDPVAGLRELLRVLRPGSAVCVTAPFVWEVHESPHDYYRYTRFGLQAILERAGFTAVRTTSFGGCFSTVAQLVRNLGGIAGQSGPDARAVPRAVAAAATACAPRLVGLDRFDTRQVLPIGHGAVARRPS